jgi:hypothetical protein
MNLMADNSDYNIPLLKNLLGKDLCFETNTSTGSQKQDKRVIIQALVLQVEYGL